VISIRQSNGGATFAVKVHPRAKENAITGELANALNVSRTSPPMEGHANEACIEFFAKLLKLPHGSVTIASGQTRRGKLIRVWAFGRGTEKQDGIDRPINFVMQRVPMSLLEIPFAFCLPGDIRRLEWRDARPSYCRRAGCRYGASSQRCGGDVNCSFRTRPCVSLLAPRIETMKMGNDPIADRFCSSLRLVSGWDDSTTGAFLTDADPAFCD
jgi:uncharacterized protein (TIGR00251 family)